MVRKLVIGLALLMTGTFLQAQSQIKDTILPATLIQVHGGVHIPGGDLTQRFGYNGSAGVSVKYKTKTNWLVGVSGSYLFGGIVKDSTLKKMRTSAGFIINTDGVPAQIHKSERGFQLYGQVGKIINRWGPNPNSGPFLLLGAGFLQHKIHFDVAEDKVPQLDEQDQKMYDRLSNGFSLSETLGFMHFSESRYVNYYVGLTFTQAWTRNRRSANEGLTDDSHPVDQLRQDYLFGLTVGWIFPIYHEQTQEYYYY